MPQLVLDIDEPLMVGLRRDAEAAGLSVSTYAREVLLRRHERNPGWVNGWPPGYFESLRPLSFERPIDLPPNPVNALYL